MIADTYANLRQLHLNALDHFIKEQLGCPGYLCYLDDFVVFGNDKTALLEIKQKIEVFLQDFRLLLHERKSRIYRCSEGVTFLGYRVFPDFTLLPSANVRRFRKRARQNVRLYWDKKITLPEFTKRLRAWEGHALRADTWRLRRQLIKEIFGKYPGTPFREVLPRNGVPGYIPNQGMAPGLLISAGRNRNPSPVQNACVLACFLSSSGQTEPIIVVPIVPVAGCDAAIVIIILPPTARPP